MRGNFEKQQQIYMFKASPLLAFQDEKSNADTMKTNQQEATPSERK